MLPARAVSLAHSGPRFTYQVIKQDTKTSHRDSGNRFSSAPIRMKWGARPSHSPHHRDQSHKCPNQKNGQEYKSARKWATIPMATPRIKEVSTVSFSSRKVIIRYSINQEAVSSWVNPPTFRAFFTKFPHVHKGKKVQSGPEPVLPQTHGFP